MANNKLVTVDMLALNNDKIKTWAGAADAQVLADAKEHAQGLVDGINNGAVAENAAAIETLGQNVADLKTDLEKADTDLGERMDEIQSDLETHTHDYDSITNKPFEVITSKDSTVLYDGTITGRNLKFSIHEYSNGYKAIVTLDGQEYESVVTFDSGLYKIIFGDYAIEQTVAEGSTWIEGVTGTHNLKVEMVKETCVLPESVIPETFAKKDYVENALRTKADNYHTHSLKDILEVDSESIDNISYEKEFTSDKEWSYTFANTDELDLRDYASSSDIIVTINDETYVGKYSNGEYPTISLYNNGFDNDYAYYIKQNDDGTISLNGDGVAQGETFAIKIETFTNDKCTIPEEYLSEEIARVSYVDSKLSEQGTSIDGIETDIENIETNVGSVDDLATANKTLVGAINEVKNAVAAGGTAAAITIDTNTTTSGALKSYTIKQGETTVGTIDIPKDMVVQSGEVVTNPAGQAAGTYIKLVLANVTEPLFINVGTLVDIYKAKASATQVQIAIDSSTREISATIVAGSVGTTELADGAVTTAKIADGNITLAKLSTGVQTSLGKADSAVQKVEVGATNGTIKVDGTEVGVAGLKSAAFAESSAFDDAGAAAAVQSKLDEEVARAKAAEEKALTDAKAYVNGIVGDSSTGITKDIEDLKGRVTEEETKSADFETRIAALEAVEYAVETDIDALWA